MKDLCLVINGSMRLPTQTIVDCIENYKKQFGAIANTIDVWIFTWKTEDSREEELRPYVYKLIADEYSPTQEQLDVLQIPYTQQLNSHPEHKICRISHYATFYGLGYAFNKIEESGEKYEYACRARNDVFIETNTNDWKTRVTNDSNAYVLPKMYWGGGDGLNDHIGFGKFETVRNVWRYEPEYFKTTLASCWNPENYIKRTIEKRGYIPHIVESSKYVIRRTGRTDKEEPIQDWILK